VQWAVVLGWRDQLRLLAGEKRQTLLRRQRQQPDAPNVRSRSVYLLKASNELAKEQGACPWFNETTYAKDSADRYLQKDLDAIVSEPLHYDWEGLRESIKTTACVTTLSALMPSETSSQISNATNGIEPPRGHVSIKASKDGMLRQVVPDYENSGNTSCCGKCRTTTATCSWWVSCSLSTSRSLHTNYDARFPSGKVPMQQQLLKDLLTAYKFGVKNAVLSTHRDGAEDAQDDLVPSIQDDGCESGV
jgi:ribonucleoside-diphosphate reductase alpha chain